MAIREDTYCRVQKWARGGGHQGPKVDIQKIEEHAKSSNEKSKNIVDFETKIKNSKVCTLQMSRKLTDSCERSTQQVSLVS